MDAELGLLLSLDGAAHETAPGAIVEFAVRRTKVTPHASATRWCCGRRRVERRGCGSTRARRQPARPRAETRRPSSFVVRCQWWSWSEFTTALQLLHDFWREVKRTLDEKGIPNDL
jgi:hypothetical protein